MQRITGNIYEQIFSDRPENGPVGVEFCQIPVGLYFWHLERFSSFPQQPGNGIEFRLRLVSLSEQHTDGKRREYEERTNQIFLHLCTFIKTGSVTWNVEERYVQVKRVPAISAQKYRTKSVHPTGINTRASVLLRVFFYFIASTCYETVTEGMTSSVDAIRLARPPQKRRATVALIHPS